MSPFRYLEWFACVVWPFAWSATFLLSFSSFASGLPWLPVQVILGWLFADAMSGVIHWAFDTFGSPETKWIGPPLVSTFREHHDQPKKMVSHGFVETNGATCIGALITIVLGKVARIPEAAVLTASFFVAWTSQIHKWAHAERVPRWVSLAQRSRIILFPRVHDGHHVAPYRSNYCIASGVLNAPLDRFHVFERSERLIRFVARLPARSWSELR